MDRRSESMNRNELLAEGYVDRKKEESALSEDAVSKWVNEFPEWEVVTHDGEPRLIRQYTFPDFVTALQFTNQIGELAEEVNHHPVIELTWGKVTLQWWTHELGGLHRNDFVMAARSDTSYSH
jgi:4a-hydroxytetrahydrobiopterin dehydratase